VGDAKLAFRECRAQCKEDVQSARDGCINRDHVCVEGCRAGRSECIDALPLDEDLAACEATLRAAKQSCRLNNPEGTPERDRCIDQAQVVAFQCRDRARERARPALKACRAGFRACARACPPGAGPIENPAQCKRDAKAAYRACRATCLEEFQFQRDACRNRDHVCVEACRTGREVCRQPVVDQLTAAVTACNTTRNTDVQTCRETYPEGPDRDQCINNVQLAAFMCRDQAREDAKPGFEACRQGFRSCVTVCPPAP
jgi:hypothetical protein